MKVVDEQLVHAPLRAMFNLARDVEEWPRYLPHYRFVRMRTPASDGGGLVEMSANRPFGALNWRTWWLSEMSVNYDLPNVRFRHVGGVTTGMDVEWAFTETGAGTQVRVMHVWNGPSWPLIGGIAATAVIGPVFVHGIACRTLAGLSAVAERAAAHPQARRHE